ncbi:LysR family transcriptional regulator [Pseudoalteromonas sp. MMG010]|uniref:LysR family transcriptional regulator n=1 Tax=Pseudoalteromonas sp. MMG010 TaxID=2822685 RepID=UPI001B3A6F3B|nr:LysR family transcriptional regulator [Pseudoalteromonas sp. MMG010]MBQ4832977.1 LysR family transcriptional regulator [Pseudoalteromonas sp. MMG010]
MNTKQLHYFLATAEKKSITAAAKKLDIAQPAVSLQLANLEHELKVKLFDRNFRGVVLTDAGQKFQKHARIILAQIEEAKTEIAYKQSQFSGKVVVGLSQSACNVLSVELLNQLEHRYPNIELTFRVGPSYIVDTWLQENKVDIALCYEAKKVTTSSLKVVDLINEDLLLYISTHPQNPAYSELAFYSYIAFEELQNYKIFMPDQKDALSQTLTKTAESLGIKLKTKDAFGQMMTTLHFVTQGLGLVVCPSSSTYHLEQNKQIRGIQIIQPNLQQKLSLIKAINSDNNAVEAVFELVREISACLHAKQHWRGNLLDKKYHIPENTGIETLIED